MVLVTNLVTAVRNLKKDPTHITKFKDLLSDAGFVNVVERKYAVPVNPWAPGKHSKAMGEMNKMNLLAVVEPMSMAVLPRGLGVSYSSPPPSPRATYCIPHTVLEERVEICYRVGRTTRPLRFSNILWRCCY